MGHFIYQPFTVREGTDSLILLSHSKDVSGSNPGWARLWIYRSLPAYSRVSNNPKKVTHEL